MTGPHDQQGKLKVGSCGTASTQVSLTNVLKKGMEGSRESLRLGQRSQLTLLTMESWSAGSASKRPLAGSADGR